MQEVSPPFLCVDTGDWDSKRRRNDALISTGIRLSLVCGVRTSRKREQDGQGSGRKKRNTNERHRTYQAFHIGDMPKMQTERPPRVACVAAFLLQYRQQENMNQQPLLRFGVGKE